MRRQLKRSLAALLCVLMISSEWTGLITPAQAAPSAPAASPAAAATATAVKPDDTGNDHPFQLDERARPNLFVHFLGDNYNYSPQGTKTLGALQTPAGFDQSELTNPDSTAAGAPAEDTPGNTWRRYNNSPTDIDPSAQVLFWVGLGIDRREILELLEGNKGLTSLEAGFYYDSRYIEPYYDATLDADPQTAYQKTIERSNINNAAYPANTQWSGDYQILRARTEMDPKTDRVTQEEVQNPSFEEIVANNTGDNQNWKMTYVSLELKDPYSATAKRRMAGEYKGVYYLDQDANGDPIAPAAAHGTGMQNAGGVQAENDYQYLLLIPFRLKQYGSTQKLDLRLARNATHFSIGGGAEGVDPYGAWERTTTRNVGRDIKLMTRFNGDLQLFGSQDVAGEVPYTAQLRIEGDYTPLSKVELGVDGDPSVWPAKATQHLQTISDLRSGLGMKVDIDLPIGYEVTVTVHYIKRDGTKIFHPYTTVTNGEKYTFVMPEFDNPDSPVVVTVTFKQSAGDRYIFLSELSRDSLGAITTDRVLGNEADIYTNLNSSLGITTETKQVNSFDPPYSMHPTHPVGCTLEPHGLGPAVTATPTKWVSINVGTHADYMAVVRIYNFTTGQYIVNPSDLKVSTARNDHRMETNPASADYGDITLPYGGIISLPMPAAELDVQIIYQPAKRYKATLEIYHKAGAAVTPMNVGQLAYLSYDRYNVSSTAYSGVVYHLHDDAVPITFPDNHRAIKSGADNRKLPWIAASQATQSGSLGGDTGRLGLTWNPNQLSDIQDQIQGMRTIMAQLYSATTLSNFGTSLSALDLNTQNVGAWTGLRKDLQGQSYGDGDVAALRGHLWDLRTRIMRDPALKSQYEKAVTKTEGTTTTTLYTYLDLTAAQVQAYLLDILDAEETDRVNHRQYDLAYQEYLKIKALWDVENAKPTINGKLAPLAEPIKPQSVTAADANGIRKYQDVDYQNGSAGDYLYDYYAYLAKYRAYITAVAAAGSVSGIALPGTAPTAKVTKTIPLRPDNDGTTADAESKLAGYKFEPNPVSASPTIETREERTVWLTLEADSAYTVESVQIYSADASNNAANLLTTVVPTKDPNYANVWSFKMPKQNCVVRVIYARRATRNVYVQIIGADDQADNLSSVEAYRQADHDSVHYPSEPPAVTPVLGVISNAGHQDVDPYPAAPSASPPPSSDPRYIYNVFVGSTVTIRVKVADEYSVKVKVRNQGSGSEPTPMVVAAPDPADGNIYTFTVDSTVLAKDDVEITITYTHELPQNDAYIDYHTVAGSTQDPGNVAEWRLENAGPPPSVTYTDFIPDVYEGTHLVGDITVQPGYYIYGVVVRGASGPYPYTLTGDGYNGGYGTGVSGTEQPVKIFVDMPDEDLHVDVYFKKGPPDVAPMNTLSLTVKDPDNRDPGNTDPATKDDPTKDDLTKVAKNWARATVYEVDPDTAAPTTAVSATLGVVGRHKNYGNDTMYDWDFVEKGKWVKVEFHADPGYYVSKVTVGPSHLGVTTNWEDDHTISFYMPAGSTGVCVEFAKGDPPTYFLTVQETWFDMNVNHSVAGDSDDFVTQADSSTIRGWNTGNPVRLLLNTNPERVPGAGASATATGAAKSGEEVTMTYIVDENNWYVQSIILFSDGAATRLTDKPVDVTPAGAAPGKKTYEVKFRMPTGNAEFTIHYRKGQRPDKRDNALTVVLYDHDNTDTKKDDNRLSATITDAVGGVGVHPKVELGLALATPLTTDVRHIHPGDIVTLETQLQKGYTVDYMVIDPSSLNLYPTWVSTVTDAAGVTKGVATFTMPDQNVAVVARYVKGTPQRYTANLILRPPDGYTVDDVGMGTFGTPTAGTLNGYPKNAIFSTSQVPGTAIDYDLYAKDGFYIEKVTIDPAVGATGSLSGSFGYQSGDFVMPGANVNVNVWFKKGWPDEAKYGLTLEVHDAYGEPNNYAKLRSAGTTAFAAPDSDPVRDGQSKTVWGAAYDKDVVVVDINAETGFYYDDSCVHITDTQGNVISWWRVPGGVAFVMPPRSTKVTVTFKEIPKDRPTHKVDLRVIDPLTGQATPADNDVVKLGALPTYAVGGPLTGNGTITGLYSNDVLALSARPGTDRYIASAYAVYDKGGNTYVVPIYSAYSVNWDTTPISVTGALAAPPTLAQFIPGDPAGAVSGQFSMPDADVTVYVKFAQGKVEPTDRWVTLKVSGPGGAGYASAVIDEPDPAKDQDLLVYTPAAPGPLPSGGTWGMDTRITQQGREVVVTFKPTDLSPAGDRYDIIKLEVYDKNGNSVPYEWISVIQDPPVLTDTGMWPPPITDPTATITHPTWKPNPDRQIKLTVPEGSVTVHVTYGKVDKDKDFTAQIVVNDPYPPKATVPSRNNAWFGPLDDAVKARLRTAKPGEWIDLSLNVHPGYKIEYIKVIPQSYGITPALPLGQLYDQNTGFYMPNGDCTVYVKFTTDTQPQKTARLIVEGSPTGNPGNYATIHSPISGTSPHVTVRGKTQLVLARPTVDWITVDYYWVANDTIASITVQTTSGESLPYTQNEDPALRHGQLVLPMAAKDVIVTIIYKDDPTPVGQEVVLHVIDKDRDADRPILRDAGGGTAVNYGRLKAVYSITVDTGLVGPDTYPLPTDDFHSTRTIYVPTGNKVDVTACSDALGLDGNGKVYIESAFVLYEAGGQMLNMNLQPDSTTPPPYGFSGLKNSKFTVHQGRNDVYVTLTRKAPTQTEYSAVLMLKGPDDNSGQAGICVGNDYNTAPADRRDELTQANHGYAYVTAKQGEGITINVVPAEGYAIDYIQVTPLGYPLSYTYRIAESTIQFDMPHCNIAITVYLKKAAKDHHKLTLHYGYVNDPSGPPVSVNDYAKISWTKEDGTLDQIWAWNNPTATPPGSPTTWGSVESTMVKGGEPVTLWATLDAPDLILSAYVLSNSSLVPLTPTFPAGVTPSDGLEGLGESASAGDNSNADALATFDMPTADTDVYLVVTNVKPYSKWHTIVLTASDTAPAGNDLGFSKGWLNEDGRPDADKQMVESFGAKDVAKSHTAMVMPETKNDGTPNYFTVDTLPGISYYLSTTKTHMVRNTPAYIQNLTPAGTSPQVHYRELVGDCNKAVHLIFESDEELSLTVEIEDPDNPGNGTVTNAVSAATTGVPTLNLTSHSVAGSYQIMTGVTSGEPVSLTVTPHTGYYAYATLYTVGSDPVRVPLSEGTGGVLTGSFTMPPNTSRVVVTFYLPYTGTLVLQDNTGYPTTKAKMTRSSDVYGLASDTVSVNALLTPRGTLTKLPRGTELVANMVDYYGVMDAGKKLTALLTANGSTTFLTGAPGGAAGDTLAPDPAITYYRHTIDRSDATITLIVDDKGTSAEEYIAAVRVVNRPAGLTAAQMPTIEDTTTPGKSRGNIWTTADDGDGVKVHVTVPDGYSVSVSAVRTDTGAPVTLTPTLTVTGDTTLTMPAADVLVTVSYARTHHRLTLHIADTSGVAGNATTVTPAAGSTLGSSPTALTVDGQSAYVRPGAAVDLSAIPATGAKIKYIFYQVAGQAPVFLAVTDPENPFSAIPLVSMPAADVDVTVVYTSSKTPDPPPSPDPQDYYIATAVKDDPANDPGNQILSIRNTSRTALLDGTALPASSPVWTAGYASDAVQVAYQAAPGYYVTVTAKAADGTVLPVLQIGATSMGTATAAFPKPGQNITITVTYSTVAPTYETNPVALQLVEHEEKTGNKAQTTDFTAPAGLTGLSLNGSALTHAPGYPNNVKSPDPVEVIKPSSTTGHDLRTLANWATGSQVVRMTIAVRDTATGLETGEVDLPISTYGVNATSRCPVPPLGAGQIPVVRVYYGNIYTATFHLSGASVPAGDNAYAIDHDTAAGTVLASTVAKDSAGNGIAKPIRNHLDHMDGYRGSGNEDIRTTATAGPNRRLVGVVWESDLTGARGTTSSVKDRYDFTMPKDDVDFYAVFEPEPKDPKDRSYIAKVALSDDSVSISGTQNALSIRNTANTKAAGGKYWVAAKGGDNIVVNVKVAPNYRAEVVATLADDAATHTPPYDYYIDRVLFYENLPGGKDATFAMPADSDATVTVKFTKGYDLSLEVTDKSLLDGTAPNVGTNQVDTVYNAAEHLGWKHDGTVSPALSPVYSPSPAVLHNKEGNKNVTTGVTTYSDPNMRVRVSWYSPFTGTTLLAQRPAIVPAATPAPSGSPAPSASPTPTPTPAPTPAPSGAPGLSTAFTMPYADTQVSVLLQDENAEDKWRARVMLRGDSDINGNTVSGIVDMTDTTGVWRDPASQWYDSAKTDLSPIPNETSTGRIFTTTDDTGHTIDMTLSVAKGYVAKVQVVRDDSMVDAAGNPTPESSWVRLDAWEYGFEHKVTTAGTPADVYTPLVADPSPDKVAGIETVEINYGEGYLAQSAFPDSISGPQHFHFFMPTAKAAVGTPGDPNYEPALPMTDVTVIVTYEKVTDMPRPFDPDNKKMDKIDLDRGFIYGENRGDFAVIEIPTLAMEESATVTKLYDTDNYDDKGVRPPVIHDTKKSSDKKVTRYVFAIYDVSNDTYTELVEGTDILLAPYDEDALDQAGDLYNYILGLYHGNETLDDTATAERDFVGSKFLLLPKPKADGTFTPGGQKVYDMLNNKGSLEKYTASDKTTRWRTTLAVMAEDAVKRQSKYTPVWIRPWFGLGVNVISYAPVHELTGELSLLMTGDELDVAAGYKDATGAVVDISKGPNTVNSGIFKHYRWDEEDLPDFTDSIVLEEGSGKWLQFLRIRSSELLGAFTTDYDPTEDFTASPAKTLLNNVKATDNLTYALAIKKDAHLTYRRVKIDLNPHSYTGTAKLADYYLNGDPSTRTFMIQDTIQLIAGDVIGNDKVKYQDYDMVADFVFRHKAWSAHTTEPTRPTSPEPLPGATTLPADWSAYYTDLAQWQISVYNPDALAYRCDLDGDRKLSVADLNIVLMRFHYNRDESDYNWHKVGGDWLKDSILPFGLGFRDSGMYSALFSLGRPVEGELLADPYWDETVDPDTEEAEELDTIWVDENDQPCQEPELPEEPQDTKAPGIQTRPGGSVQTPEDRDEREEIPQGEEAQSQRLDLPLSQELPSGRAPAVRAEDRAVKEPSGRSGPAASSEREELPPG